MPKNSTLSELGIVDNNIPNIFSGFSEVDAQELTEKRLYFSESTRIIPLSQLDPDSTYLASGYYNPETMLQRREDEEEELFLLYEEIDGPWSELDDKPNPKEFVIKNIEHKIKLRPKDKTKKYTPVTFERDANRESPVESIASGESPSISGLVTNIIDRLEKLPKFLSMKPRGYAVIKNY